VLTLGIGTSSCEVPQTASAPGGNKSGGAQLALTGGMEQPILSPSSAHARADLVDRSGTNEAYSSGVSWGAVAGGAFAAAALSLILLALGAGIGLSSVSPWSTAAASVSTIGWEAIVWLVLTQFMSASLGGYLAGRLRTKWATIHTDEVYFRDTANGFLAWAVAVVFTAACLTSAAGYMVGGSATYAESSGLRPGAQADGRPPASSNAYFVDALLRSDEPKADANRAVTHDEVDVILGRSIRLGDIPAADRAYLTHVVETHAGLSQADADKRVSEVFAGAQQSAEATRKTVAHGLFWVFLALLVGAFSASFAATIGGRARDHVVHV
jgi:hypothetical protein